MLKKHRLSFSALSILLIFCIVFISDKTYINAIEQNSYWYLSQNLDRPDLISYETAKDKGHIKRLKDKENENSFVFENIDGTITSYTYQEKVQTKDSKGNLSEIDLDMKPNKNSNGVTSSYSIDGNGYTISLPVISDSANPFVIKKSNYSLSFYPINTNEKSAKCAPGQLKKLKDQYYGSIEYAKAFGDHTSLQLSTTLTGIKEDIILSKKPDSNIFSYNVTAPGLAAKVTPAGVVQFYNKETLEIISSIPAPYAIDSYKGERIEGEGHYTENIKVTMEPTGLDSWIYSLNVDSKFLNDPKTEYPITIDPPVTIYSSAQEDTYVASGTPGINYWNTGFMCVGRDSTLLACRSYVKFNLTSLTSQDALIVTDALYNTEEIAGYTSDCYVQIFKIITSWSSTTLDWEPQPNCESPSVDSVKVNGARAYSFDITSLVEGWFLNAKSAGGFANNGFVMKSDREGSLVYRKFRSANAATNPPNITIQYTAVDRVAPNAPTGLTTSYIKNASYNGTAQLKASWNAATDLPTLGGSGIKHYKVVVKRPDGSVADDVVTTSTSYTSALYYDDNTTYTFYVRAVDNAKTVNNVGIYNESTDSVASLAVPDCEKPTINSSSNSAYTSAANLTFSWNVTEPVGLSKIEFRISGILIYTVSTPSNIGTASVPISGFSEGLYSLTVTFIDNSNNPISTVKTFSIDRTSPTISTTFNQTVVGDTFSFPLYFTDNQSLSNCVVYYGAGENPSSYIFYNYYFLSGTSANISSLTINASNWSNGQPYTIKAVACDSAGNPGAVLYRTVTCDSSRITIQPDVALTPIPETITTPNLSISHNYQATRPSDIIINDSVVDQTAIGEGINEQLNKQDIPENSNLELIVRAPSGNSEPAAYNISRDLCGYRHGMDNTNNLELSGVTIDTSMGYLRLAAGMYSGSAILTVPTNISGNRVDGVKLFADDGVGTGQTITYSVYDPGLATWVPLTENSWCYFGKLADQLKIKIDLSRISTSSSQYINTVSLTFTDLGAAETHIVKLIPDVTNLSVKLTDGVKGQLSWSAIPEINGISPVYQVYRGGYPEFAVEESSLLFSSVTGTTVIDSKIISGQTFFYKVRAVYPGLNGSGETATDRVGGVPVTAKVRYVPNMYYFRSNTGSVPLHQTLDLDVNGETGTADLYTGNFNYMATDLILPEWQFNMSIQRNYNSRMTLSTLCGQGWDLSLHQYIFEEYTGIGNTIPAAVTFKDYQGTYWTFPVSSSNGEITGYTTPNGCPYTLSKENGLYRLTDSNGIINGFDQNMNLSYVLDNPWLQETEITDENSISKLSKVTLNNNQGNLAYEFTVDYDVNGLLTGFTAVDTSCPFTLTLADGQYKLTETATPYQEYYFDNNDTAAYTEKLSMQTVITNSMSIKTAKMTYTYDSVFKLEHVSDHAGHEISLFYDSEGRISSITDLEGRILTYGYMTNNLLQTVFRLDHYTDPVNQTEPIYAKTYYTYDLNGCLTSICDPDNVVTQLEFNSARQIIRHSTLYKNTTDLQTQMQTYWRNVTLIDYVGSGATIRYQMQKSEKAAQATVETLLETVRLKKTDFSSSLVSGQNSTAMVFYKPTLTSGEDGLDEPDYVYTLLQTITYLGSDTDTDGFIDSINETISDGDGSTPDIINTNSIGKNSEYYFLNYSENEAGTVTLYDLSGRVANVCKDYTNHNNAGHVCQKETYTLAGRMIEDQTAKGLITHYEYDSTGKVSRTQYPDKRVAVTSYDFISNPQLPFTEVYFSKIDTDYGYNYTSESYTNALQQTILEKIRSTGDWTSLSYCYNGMGQKTTQTDKTGNVTTYTYNGNNQVLTETVDQIDGPDLVTSNMYNGDNVLICETDPYGNTVEYNYYDSTDALTVQADPIDSTLSYYNAEDITEKLLYKKISTYNSEVTTEEYRYCRNADHVIKKKITITTLPNGTSTTKTDSKQANTDLDKTENKMSVSNLSNGTEIQQSVLYNADGKIDTIGHNGFSYIFIYDTEKNLSEIKVDDGTNSYTLIKKNITENADGSSTNTNTYYYKDPNTNIVTETRTATTTDSLGRTDKIEYYNGSTTETRYEYEYSSENSTSTDLDGDEITTAYDYSTGRKTTSNKSDDSDSFNQNVVVTDLSSALELYSYSVVNTENTVEYTTNISGTTQLYTYNKNTTGKLDQTSYTLPDLTAVVKMDHYGDYGQKNSSVLSLNGQSKLQKTYTYQTISGVNFSNQVDTESIQTGSGTAVYSYDYDEVGNICKIQITENGVTSDLFRYKYDEAGQLIREDNVASDKTTVWQYDIGGNISNKKEYALTAEGVEPTAPVQTINYGYSTGPWKDQLISYNGQSISDYDYAGNPRNYLGATLTWTMGRQLESYTKDGLAIQYKYNDQGLRTRKAVGSSVTDYFLSGNQIITEKTGQNSINYRYDINGELIGMRYSGTEYYYVKNIQGDVIGLIDCTGDYKVKYSYDAWGKLLTLTDGNGNDKMTDTSFIGHKNPYRYRGYYYDNETSLYYLQSRYYDPEVRRFINADNTSILQATTDRILGFNLYAYCENKVIMNSDPSGLDPWYILPFWGYMHAIVQMYLSKKFGLATEVRTTLFRKRIDLYDKKLKQGWEIKPITTPYHIALGQLSMYRFLMKGEMTYGRNLGNFSFGFGFFKIKIYSFPLGIIYYTFDITEYAKTLMELYGASALKRWLQRFGKWVSNGMKNVNEGLKQPEFSYDNPLTGDSLWP